MATLAALVLAAPAAAEAPCEDPRHVDGLGTACPAEPGGWHVKVGPDVSGTWFYTHGPDPPAQDLVDPPAASHKWPDPADPACVGPPHAEFHVQAIYAVAPGAIPNPIWAQDHISDKIRGANGWIREASLEEGGPAQDVKVACDGKGDILVEVATIPPTDSFTQVVAALRAQGYDQPNQKYWVFAHGVDSEWGGTATLVQDDDPGRLNANNRGPSYAVMWGYASHLTWLHELMHTMGAVQTSAPNHYLNYGGHHCDDNEDIMCYGPETRLVCDELHLDCNHDDYYDPTPEAGSYLDRAWNIADPINLFLTPDPCQGDVEVRSPGADTCPASAGANRTHASLASASVGGNATSNWAAASGAGNSTAPVAATGVGHAQGTVPVGAGTCNGTPCFGLAEEDDARGYWAGASLGGDAVCEGAACVSVTGHGEATCEASQCAVLSLEGPARCDVQNACLAASGTGPASASTAAASGAGNATAPVAASGAGDADGTLVGASLGGDAWGVAAASGDGDAEGTFALTGTGDARGDLVAASVDGTCNGRTCYEAHPTDDVGAETAAASGTGNASAQVAASGTGDSQGTVAVSGTGSADGPVSFSACGYVSGFAGGLPCGAADDLLP